MNQIPVIAAMALLALSFAACGERHAAGPTPILLFNGTGTSPNDVAAVKTLLAQANLSYLTVNSTQLNALSESRLRDYQLLIIPGGNYLEMNRSLATNTTANLRRAVQQGLNYLGICAGAILAGNPGTNGLNLTGGVRFKFYAVVNQGIHRAAVPVTVVGGPTLEQYWEDGPELTGWGAVVGKYPDGTPAIAEGACGSGWVVLSGIHAEAPAYWRRGQVFQTTAEADNNYAVTLINAALHRTVLPHY